MSANHDGYFERRLAARMGPIREAQVAAVRDGALTVGRFTYGTENLTLRQWDESAVLTIGSFCSLASAITVFLGGNHRTDWITTFPFGHIFEEQLGGIGIKGHPTSRGDVAIGHDVWVGHGCTIMSGVVIGDGAAIAANSHIVKDVAPYEVVGGNPACHIRFRFDPEIRDLLLKLRWWNWPLQTIRSRAPELCNAPDRLILSSWI